MCMRKLLPNPERCDVFVAGYFICFFFLHAFNSSEGVPMHCPSSIRSFRRLLHNVYFNVNLIPPTINNNKNKSEETHTRNLHVLLCIKIHMIPTKTKTKKRKSSIQSETVKRKQETHTHTHSQVRMLKRQNFL